MIEDLAKQGQTLHYSNTTLTRVLKPALGGSTNGVMGPCNTLMLGCISPLRVHVQRTRDTLDFLAKARAAAWRHTLGLHSALHPLSLLLGSHSLLAALLCPGLQAGTVKNSVSADVTALRAHQRQAESLAAQAEATERLRSENAALESQLKELRIQRGGREEMQLSRAEVEELQRQVAELRAQVARERVRAEAQELLVKQMMLGQQQGTAAERGGGEEGLDAGPAAATPAAAAGGEGAAGVAAPAGPGSAGTPVARRLSVFNAAAALAAMQATPVLLAAEAASEVVASPSELLQLLDTESICITGGSNLTGVQLAMLEGLVARKLDETPDAGGGESLLLGGSADEGAGATAVVERQLRQLVARREREVEALLLAVHVYNECLGEAQTDLAAVQEDLAAALALKEQEFQQLVQGRLAAVCVPLWGWQGANFFLSLFFGFAESNQLPGFCWVAFWDHSFCPCV